MNMGNSRFRYKLLSRDSKLRITDIDSCLYAVSISDETKSIDKALVGLLWAKGRFPKCSVLLGDSLFQFTRQLIVEKPGDNPRNTDTICRDVVAQIMVVAGAETEILRTSGVQDDIRYGDFLSTITGDYERDIRFRESVDNTASSYVERQVSRGKIPSHLAVEARNISKEYLLREIAVYDLLASDGWITDVYLGHEIEPLALIITGEIKNCGRMLHMRNNISIRTR